MKIFDRRIEINHLCSEVVPEKPSDVEKKNEILELNKLIMVEINQSQTLFRLTKWVQSSRKLLFCKHLFKYKISYYYHYYLFWGELLYLYVGGLAFLKDESIVSDRRWWILASVRLLVLWLKWISFKSTFSTSPWLNTIDIRIIVIHT